MVIPHFSAAPSGAPLFDFEALKQTVASLPSLDTNVTFLKPAELTASRLRLTAAKPVIVRGYRPAWSLAPDQLLPALLETLGPETEVLTRDVLRDSEGPRCPLRAWEQHWSRHASGRPQSAAPPSRARSLPPAEEDEADSLSVGAQARRAGQEQARLLELEALPLSGEAVSELGRRMGSAEAWHEHQGGGSRAESGHANAQALNWDVLCQPEAGTDSCVPPSALAPPSPCSAAPPPLNPLLPPAVQELDLVAKVWPPARGPPASPAPRTLCALALHPPGSAAPAAQAPDGAAAWVLVLGGRRSLALFPPSGDARALYAASQRLGARGRAALLPLLARLPCHGGGRLELGPGDLCVLPAGWLAGALCCEPTAVLGGCLLRADSLRQHLEARALQDAGGVAPQKRFPRFKEILWLAAAAAAGALRRALPGLGREEERRRAEAVLEGWRAEGRDRAEEGEKSRGAEWETDRPEPSSSHQPALRRLVRKRRDHDAPFPAEALEGASPSGLQSGGPGIRVSSATKSGARVSSLVSQARPGAPLLRRGSSASPSRPTAEKPPAHKKRRSDDFLDDEEASGTSSAAGDWAPASLGRETARKSRAEALGSSDDSLDLDAHSVPLDAVVRGPARRGRSSSCTEGEEPSTRRPMTARQRRMCGLDPEEREAVLASAEEAPPSKSTGRATRFAGGVSPGLAALLSAERGDEKREEELAPARAPQVRLRMANGGAEGRELSGEAPHATSGGKVKLKMGAHQGLHGIPQTDGAGDAGTADEGGAAASAPGGAARSLRKRLCIESEESEGEDVGSDSGEGARGEGARGEGASLPSHVESDEGIKAESDERTRTAISTPLDHLPELPPDSTLDVAHGPTRQGLAILFETLRTWLSHARALNDVPLAVPDPWHLLASCHVLAAGLGFPAASAERPLPSSDALEAALERVRASMSSSGTWGSHGEGAHLRPSTSAPSPLPGLASPAKGAMVVVEESSGPAVPRLAPGSNPSSASGPVAARRSTSTAGGAASGGAHAPLMAKPRKGPSVKDRLQKKLKLR